MQVPRKNVRASRSPRGRIHTRAVFPAGYWRGVGAKKGRKQCGVFSEGVNHYRSTRSLPRHSRRSSGRTAAGLKALALKAQGQARRHVFPRAAPLQPAQRRVPRAGGGQGRAGGRQDISLSLYLDYFEMFKKEKGRKEKGEELRQVMNSFIGN